MSQPQSQQRVRIVKDNKEWHEFEKELKRQVAESQRKSKETV